jgi:hypothetical protein
VPTVRTRSLILAALRALSALVVGEVTPQPALPAAPRFPSDQVLGVDGWRAGDAHVNLTNGNAYLVRFYERDGAAASLTFELTTGPTGKNVYHASAEVPYLGNGYTVEAAPSELTSRLAPAESAFVARSGVRGWLEVHAYGERRGLVANLAAGWALVALDLLLGRSNDYYLERVVAPLGADPEATVDLALALFPRVAVWYESTP